MCFNSLVCLSSNGEYLKSFSLLQVKNFIFQILWLQFDNNKKENKHLFICVSGWRDIKDLSSGRGREIPPSLGRVNYPFNNGVLLDSSNGNSEGEREESGKV